MAMSDHFVTVASYHILHQAQLAKNFLEAEGIAVFLTGENTADIWAGVAEEVHLQVNEHDAQRAVRLLAEVEAQAGVDDNWEDQAEGCAWTCELCGGPVNNRFTVCPACQTPSPHIKAGPPNTFVGGRGEARTGEEVKVSDQITTRARAPASGITDKAGPEEPEAGRGSGCALLLALLAAPALWLWLR
jgi:hypothetical protein